MLDHQAWIASERGGHAVGDQQLRRLTDVVRRGPLPQVRVELVVASAAAGVGREVGRGRPRGPPERVDQRLPLRVGRDRDGKPGLVLAPAVEPLRRDVRAAVPVALEQVAVGGLLQHQLARGVERAFDHGDLEQAPAPGRFALGETDDERERGVHPCVRVAGALLDPRLVVDVAGDPRHAGDLLHRLREAHVVAPRSRQAERGHPHEEAARVERLDLLPVEPEVAEHPRREVLEHRVALADEPAQHRQPVVGAEVEGEVALVGVRAEVVRAALPPRAFHARARRRWRACRRCG